MTEITFAGLRAFSMSMAGFSFQLIMSIFSPRSSFTTALTLEPLTPTQAPTASTSGSFDHTAIFVRFPASLAIALISTIPSLTSATSDSKSLLTSSGCVRETRIFGPFDVIFTSMMKSLMRSFGWKVSPRTCSFSVRMASALPRLMLTLLPMYLCTTPVTTSLSLL